LPGSAGPLSALFAVTPESALAPNVVGGDDDAGADLYGGNADGDDFWPWLRERQAASPAGAARAQAADSFWQQLGGRPTSWADAPAATCPLPADVRVVPFADLDEQVFAALESADLPAGPRQQGLRRDEGEPVESGEAAPAARTLSGALGGLLAGVWHTLTAPLRRDDKRKKPGRHESA
jgi:hypothetical protein